MVVSVSKGLLKFELIALVHLAFKIQLMKLCINILEKPTLALSLSLDTHVSEPDKFEL
jgi:hypothetical protein